MQTIDLMVTEFLKCRKIAIVGVSEKRETGANFNYKKFKQAGYTVFAVNPALAAFDGNPCYPDLKSIPDRPEAVFILASPPVTEEIVRQCVDLGIRQVWMHNMMGTKPGLSPSVSSVSPEAVQLCREHGITVIPGSCPAQFLKPDVGHGMMRGLWRLFGNLKVVEE